MKPERCPCCQQIIPPKLAFPPVKQRIYDYIASHPEGVTRAQMLDYVYADDINGGPETPSIISVHLSEMKDVLARAGLKIASSWGPGAKYRLISLDLASFYPSRLSSKHRREHDEHWQQR